MKYIAAKIENREFIFVFPVCINHDDMWEALGFIKFHSVPRDWSRALRVKGKVVGAGFIRDGKCYGRSETLNVDSRGDLDTHLLSTNGSYDDADKHCKRLNEADGNGGAS